MRYMERMGRVQRVILFFYEKLLFAKYAENTVKNAPLYGIFFPKFWSSLRFLNFLNVDELSRLVLVSIAWGWIMFSLSKTKSGLLDDEQIYFFLLCGRLRIRMKLLLIQQQSVSIY